MSVVKKEHGRRGACEGTHSEGKKGEDERDEAPVRAPKRACAADELESKLTRRAKAWGQRRNARGVSEGVRTIGGGLTRRLSRGKHPRRSDALMGQARRGHMAYGRPTSLSQRSDVPEAPNEDLRGRAGGRARASADGVRVQKG